MSSSLNDYLGAASAAVRQQDGAQLQELLRFHNMQPVLRRPASFDMLLANAARSRLPGELWARVFQHHVTALAHVADGRYEAAQAEYARSDGPLASLTEFMRDNADELWAGMAMEQVVANLKTLSDLADSEMRRSGRQPNKIENCGRLLQNAFSQVGVPRGSGVEGQKRASLAIAANIIKVQFALNNITGCTQTAKAVRTVFGDNLQHAAASYRVTMFYYLGRIELYQEHYGAAGQYLSDAFRDCLASATDHKRKILRYLVPVKMLLGELPTDGLLEAYHLSEYADIKRALQAGDVGLLTRTMADRQHQFLRAGTYLLLEKLHLACYRRLFKKCALAWAEAAPSKATQLPLALMQAALATQGVEQDIDEVECILANLVVRGYIKGYIAHKPKLVVLSKQDPFPPASEKWLRDVV